jgi:hypothetical protein
MTSAMDVVWSYHCIKDINPVRFQFGEQIPDLHIQASLVISAVIGWFYQA